MNRVLITGGAGYIGSVISNLLLQNGYSVRVVDLLWFKRNIPLGYISNPNYNFIKGDICDDNLIDNVLKDIDFVIHAAAVVGEPASEKFPELTRRINYEASIKLIDKVEKSGIKGFIFLSSCSNYGISDGVATEDSPLNPLSLYAETKVNAERHLMEKKNNLNWIICRLSTVYGVSPRMRFDLTVNDFAMNAYMKKYLDIFSSHTYRPYIHVYDVARVIKEMLKNFAKIKNNIFNVGFNGENHQKIQIAEIIRKFVPETKIKTVKMGTDLRNYQVDFLKLKKFLNIKNTNTVEGGIKEVLDLLRKRVISNPYESCYYNTTPDLERE